MQRRVRIVPLREDVRAVSCLRNPQSLDRVTDDASDDEDREEDREDDVDWPLA